MNALIYLRVSTKSKRRRATPRRATRSPRKEKRA